MQKDILTVVLLLFLVSMSAYFSASETAFSSLNITRIKSLAEKGNKKADLVLKLSAQYDKLLSSKSWQMLEVQMAAFGASTAFTVVDWLVLFVGFGTVKIRVREDC